MVEAVTDETGHFLVPRGREFRLADGVDDWRLPRLQRLLATDHLVAYLYRDVRLLVHVVSEASGGAAPPDLEVVVVGKVIGYQAGDPAPPGCPEQNDYGWMVRHEMDAPTRFARTASGDYIGRLPRLPLVAVAARSFGFKTAWTQFDSRDMEEDHKIELRLVPTRRVEGTLRGPDGSALARHAIHFYADNVNAPSELATAMDAAHFDLLGVGGSRVLARAGGSHQVTFLWAGQTDEHGHYETYFKADGELSIVVPDDRWPDMRLQIETKDPLTRADLQFSEAASSGRVILFNDGVPLSNWRLVLSDITTSLQTAVAIDLGDDGGMERVHLQAGRKYWLYLHGKKELTGGLVPRGDENRIDVERLVRVPADLK